MTINDYIDACIHFNSDTQLWHELDPKKYYYAPDASADWWREDCDHSAPGFALEWAFHKNMPLSARTGGPVKQVLYIHEHAAQELLNQFLEFVQQGVDENFDNEQWDALFALVK